MKNATPPTRTISALARDVGVNVETIRYYERIGMLRQPRKPSRGWRQYDQDALRRVRFVKRSQELGFTLTEIKELLALRASASPRTCDRVGKKAREKVDQIDTKVRDLLAIKGTLVGLARACEDRGEGAQCPILDALDP